MEDTIYNALKEAGKPLKNKEIAELTGLDVKEVTKLTSKMKKEGRIISPKNCFYAVE
jgi:Mn-dependent DtxR family transcriptional regulator